MTSRPSTFTQITTRTGKIQAENQPATIKDWLSYGSADFPAGSVQSAYLHVPFCFHKCHYCDFYSIVDNQDRQAAFVERLIDEMRATESFRSPPMQTMFIGGGTPTLLAPKLWVKLLAVMHEHLALEIGGEFTVECNPETLTAELASILVDGGINRVSIGCQSFNPVHLKTLERWHDPRNVHRSVELLRAAGIDNINLDLIFAIPGQSLDEWQADVDEALSLNPSHMSCYGLVYEPNTPLTVKMKAGDITPCEQEIEAEMYQATIERLADAGFEHYEISNFAKIQNPIPRHRDKIQNHSHRCRHNMAYWTNRNWWPLGPSASGHVNGLRWKNVARLGEYLEHGPLPRVTDVERMDEDGCIGEAFMLGLRLIDGMTTQSVNHLLDRGRRAEERRRAIEQHRQGGLLIECDDRLRLSSQGLMLADRVLSDLI